MMARILPYPLLAIGLAIMWLMLSGVTRGQLVLAIGVGVGATHALKTLGEARPQINSLGALFRLLGIVIVDIVRSNVAVAKILLTGEKRERRSGFVKIHLRLTNPVGLAILSIVITSTPGTAWIDFNSASGELLIHVFDLHDGDDWPGTITGRYEKLLLEAFE
ncbi:MAG: Na+/H+ antiporter subunit E [Mesorhizobium sp.]